jgi:hypothetical protein
LGEGVDPLAIVIERQISYFADEDGLDGALKVTIPGPWVQVFEVTRNGLTMRHRESHSNTGRVLMMTLKTLYVP